MITKRAKKTNYLMFHHFSTINDHLKFLLVGSTRYRTLPRLIEMLSEAYLNVNSKAGKN